MPKLIADFNLGSNRAQARAQLTELEKKYPKTRYLVQFNQHAPEGYDDAYSVYIFDKTNEYKENEP